MAQQPNYITAAQLMNNMRGSVLFTITRIYSGKAKDGSPKVDLYLKDNTISEEIKYTNWSDKFASLQPKDQVIAHAPNFMRNPYTNRNGEYINQGVIKFDKVNKGYLEVYQMAAHAPVGQPVQPAQPPAFTSAPNIAQQPRGNQTEAQLVKSLYPRFFQAMEQLFNIVAPSVQETAETNRLLDILWEGM